MQLWTPWASCCTRQSKYSGHGFKLTLESCILHWGFLAHRLSSASGGLGFSNDCSFRQHLPLMPFGSPCSADFYNMSWSIFRQEFPGASSGLVVARALLWSRATTPSRMCRPITLCNPLSIRHWDGSMKLCWKAESWHQLARTRRSRNWRASMVHGNGFLTTWGICVGTDLCRVLKFVVSFLVTKGFGNKCKTTTLVDPFLISAHVFSHFGNK